MNKATRNKWITGVVIVVVLAGAFFFGGNFPKPDGGEMAPVVNQGQDQTAGPPQGQEPSGEPTLAEQTPDEPVAPKQPDSKPEPNTPDRQEPPPQTGTEDPAQPTPQPGGEEEPGEKEFRCTLSIRCDTLLKNLERLNPDKTELVPGDGVLFVPTAVTFYEGETVFNLLQRELKKAKIHMEFVDTPAYNSAYIEGIGNLYEFDCGELSGWVYRVNGEYPGYGCSHYELKDGDTVEWLYTCDLGRDVGAPDVLEKQR